MSCGWTVTASQPTTARIAARTAPATRRPGGQAQQRRGPGEGSGERGGREQHVDGEVQRGHRGVVVTGAPARGAGAEAAQDVGAEAGVEQARERRGDRPADQQDQQPDHHLAARRGPARPGRRNRHRSATRAWAVGAGRRSLAMPVASSRNAPAAASTVACLHRLHPLPSSRRRLPAGGARMSIRRASVLSPTGSAVVHHSVTGNLPGTPSVRGHEARSRGPPSTSASSAVAASSRVRPGSA